ncbi:MAG: GtrA family protein [Candidatus Gastranaerophilales bacterium]|nr:GtrA family protein [Candidatus Gastranaerophilales bacterium]
MNLFIIDEKFIKFLIVGGLNTIFGYSVYALFLFIGLHYSIAILLAYLLGVLFNFKTTGILVFNNSNNILIFKFIGVYCIIYILNVFFLGIFDSLKFNMFLAGAILILPMALLSFILNKNLVFKGENE